MRISAARFLHTSRQALKKRISRRGAEILEFTLALPLLLLITFGMFDLTKVYTMYTEIGYYSTKALMQLSTGGQRDEEHYHFKINDIPTAVNIAKNTFAENSMFRGSIVKGKSKFQFDNKGFKHKRGASSVGQVLCIKADVPVELSTPLIRDMLAGKEGYFTIHKETCTIGEREKIVIP